MSNTGVANAPRPMVDFEQIMDRLARLDGIAIEVREKAGAIKSAPSPGSGKETAEPCDASGRILAAINRTTNILIDARESLQAFI